VDEERLAFKNLRHDRYVRHHVLAEVRGDFDGGNLLDFEEIGHRVELSRVEVDHGVWEKPAEFPV